IPWSTARQPGQRAASESLPSPRRLPYLDPDSTIALAVAILALLASSLAGAAETALGSLGPARLEHLLGRAEADSGRGPSDVISALSLAKALALVVLAAAAVELTRSLYGTNSVLSFEAAILLVLGVVVAQVAPSTVASYHPEAIAQWAAQPAQVVAFALGPLIRALSSVTGMALRVLDTDADAVESNVSGEDLRRLVGAGEGLEADERQMIHGIFEMEDTAVREIMVPRLDVNAVPVDTPLGKVVDLVIASGHSRLPVYRGSLDTIVGIAYAKDLLRHLTAGQTELPVQSVARPAHFVPESKRVQDLLRELQRKKVHMAIVVDEYGGTAGLITIEDLLEEIVGEIQDEYDSEEERISPLDEGQAVFDGMVAISDVNQVLGLALEAEDVDTIGGLVLQKLGRVPAVGDEVPFAGGVVTVLSVVRRRIKRVRVSRQTEAAESAAASEGAPAAEGEDERTEEGSL
ncbi:MAG: hemolysin family protein, partial [Actinobacteria bacterium]|nr:hemolysin family protein [Actinomycetota bacterium]